METRYAVVREHHGLRGIQEYTSFYNLRQNLNGREPVHFGLTKTVANTLCIVENDAALIRAVNASEFDKAA